MCVSKDVDSVVMKHHYWILQDRKYIYHATWLIIMSKLIKAISSQINARQRFLLATSLRFERCWCSQWYYYRHAVIIIIRMSFSNLPPTQKEEKSFADTIRKRKEEKRLQLLRRSFLLVWFWCITGIIAFLAYWNKLRNHLCWFLKYRYFFGVVSE